MDYEKKYKEALERAKSLYGNCPVYSERSKTASIIFPELKESEDERVRKNCIHFLELQKQHHAATFEIEECIAWLEKQKKQKPAISDDALREGIAYFGISQYQIDNWLKKYVDIDHTDMHSFIPSELSDEQELLSIFKMGWDVYKGGSTPFEVQNSLSDPLPPDKIYECVNNLIEKSINNYLIIRDWYKAKNNP